MELAKENTYHISVLISTKNRPHDLKECIDSILIQIVKPDEIILVDASDTHESMEMVKESLMNKGIKLTHYKQEVVAGKIRKTATWNKAVRLALGDIIIFLDDDVVLDKHYIYHILKTYDENPESIVGVMGRFKNPKEDNATQERLSFLYLLNKFIYKLFLLPHETGRGVIQPSGFPEYPSSKNDVLHVEVMPTGNMSIKKEVFQEFAFDEWFHGYSYQEDDDFSYRVSRKYQFLYTPFAELIHKASPKARDSIESVETMKVINHYYFFKKNMPKSFKNCLAFIWSELGLLLLKCISFASYKSLFLSLMGLVAYRSLPAIKGRLHGYDKIINSVIRKESIGC